MLSRAVVLLWATQACSPHAAPQTVAAASPTPQTSSPPAAQPPARPSLAAAPSSAPTGSPGAPVPCGALRCLEFESPEAAFDHVLAAEPLILALGEAHAQRGTEAIASTTRRFTELLLPRLSTRARALVVEVLDAGGKCGRVEQRVAEQQRPVTEPQAASNQSEFFALAERAKSLGIRPLPLRPTCEEYAAITRAGAADVDLMLRTIADASVRTFSALLDAPPKAGSPTLLLAYGGALHNDLMPRPGREHWSFGPALREKVAERYLELDLIVPEYVKDTESWRAFPWYDAYQSVRDRKQTLLFNPSRGSFVLVFPRSSP